MRTIRSYPRPIRSALIALATASLLTSGTVGAAVASEPDSTETIEMPMVVVGYDREIAEEHGYEIRTSPDGTEYSVLKGTPESVTPARAGAIQPMGVVTGDCGSSYVNIYNPAARRYTTTTGFGVYTAAVGYTWSVNVVGPNYNYTHRWHGALALNKVFHMSSSARQVTNRGDYTAKATGWTTHVNGAICRSLGPIDVEYIL
jgi:hypothetical protein